jgi:hypothetical protein
MKTMRASISARAASACSTCSTMGVGSDTLPERLAKEPATGGSEGLQCEVDETLADCCMICGCDSGVVLESKPKELGS